MKAIYRIALAADDEQEIFLELSEEQSNLLKLVSEKLEKAREKHFCPGACAQMIVQKVHPDNAPITSS